MVSKSVTYAQHITLHTSVWQLQLWVCIADIHIRVWTRWQKGGLQYNKTSFLFLLISDHLSSDFCVWFFFLIQLLFVNAAGVWCYCSRKLYTSDINNCKKQKQKIGRGNVRVICHPGSPLFGFVIIVGVAGAVALKPSLSQMSHMRLSGVATSSSPKLKHGPESRWAIWPEV